MTNLNIFRAYDIRGIWQNDLDEGIASRIAAAYASILRSKNISEVLIARDVRNSGEDLQHAFTESLKRNGISVTELGRLPLGGGCFSSWKSGKELAYLTASHLPAEWNGIKFFHPTGMGWVENENRAIRDSFEKGMVAPSSA